MQILIVEYREGKHGQLEIIGQDYWPINRMVYIALRASDSKAQKFRELFSHIPDVSVSFGIFFNFWHWKISRFDPLFT